ncbi:hypothetical protein RDWZM_010098 [Blomia tropicalis]|uniref:orotate phosphoribosyltransferase n=1 Tax=Blomia tropicalis TaxID=40697 RepID=A0A9Q0LW54_BLOTA|nr:orotidine-5'-phosphate decarboxylase [Blomia tropicalis]KAJ6215598.1 hypothetical protein RDWZM_010098 [Blomia tropicalis]
MPVNDQKPCQTLDNDNEFNQIVYDLWMNEGFLIGDYMLKTGQMSPFYINLRRSISIPNLLGRMSRLMYEQIDRLTNDRTEPMYDMICGVPYMGLMFATCISQQYNQKMLMLRKEAKQYGTKEMIEGIYRPGQRVLLIEDVLSSGTSIIESVIAIRQCGLIVDDVVVFLDRNERGKQNVEHLANVRVHCTFTLNHLLHGLRSFDFITEQQADCCRSFVDLNPGIISDPLRKIALQCADMIQHHHNNEWK